MAASEVPYEPEHSGAHLEEEVRALRAEVDELKRQFAEFRKQFD